MKSFLYYISPIIFFIISCTGYSEINPEYKLDTSKAISSKIVIFVSPTLKEIDKIKSKEKNLEDFYIAADDLNYSNYKAEEFLDKLNVPHKETEEKKLIFLVNGKVTETDYSNSDEHWFVLIYNGKDKPVKTYSIDIESHEALLKQLSGTPLNP